MKFRLQFIALLAFSFGAQAQDSLMMRRIADTVLLHSPCYDNLRILCKTIGKRISGSPEAARAVVWAAQKMKETGADKVWLQPVDVPHWVRGKEKLRLKYDNGAYQDVVMLSLGNSYGTDGKVVEAPVIMVRDVEEFNALPPGAVKGKIVFFNYRFRQDLVNTFDGYSDAVRYRGYAATWAGSKGAVGTIIRSISTGADDMPHTGAIRKDSVNKIPAVAIGNFTADRLEQECTNGKVTAAIQSDCRMMPEPVRSYNVIGEILGSEHPEQIIAVGGHLDSWDVGEGANDDGSGVVQSMEVLRAFKALGIKPKHTIRAVLFMNEENGLRGGLAYADSAKNNKNEQHILAIETDAGSFSPRGLGMEMSEAKKEKIRAFAPLFLPYGVYDFSKDEGGADIGLLGKQGVPMMGLMPDSQRYFDLHHTNNDVFENVNHRELKLGASTLAQIIYLVDEHGL
jgi:carboxypeptidase Q